MIEPKKEPVVVHGPNGRPAEPPVGMIYFDRATGYREQWDGSEWAPLKRSPGDK